MRGRSSNLWWGTALEAPDPEALADFYSTLLDWPVVHQEPGTAADSTFQLRVTGRDGVPADAD